MQKLVNKIQLTLPEIYELDRLVLIVVSLQTTNEPQFRTRNLLFKKLKLTNETRALYEPESKPKNLLDSIEHFYLDGKQTAVSHNIGAAPIIRKIQTFQEKEPK